MKKTLLFLFALVTMATHAQTNIDIAQTYNGIAGLGFNNEVSKITQQTDGKILIGGSFTTYNGVTANRFIRLNRNGTIDTTFDTGTGFNNAVDAITIQADGKILVGGGFTTYKGVSQNRIIRLNADGSKDTSFNIGTGFDDDINDIVEQEDGKILVIGDFTTYKGINQEKLIRLNSNGTKDTSFDIVLGFNGSYLRKIIQLANGKILVGGSFFSYQGVSANCLVRLNTNGSVDTTFNIGSGFNTVGGVNDIEVQSDGKILVAGGFTTYNGSPSNYIIRLNANGSRDTTFASDVWIDDAVFTIKQQTDGRILVGGEFDSFYDYPENRIIRLENNGSKDFSFQMGTGFTGADFPFVNDIEQQADGKILIGGRFTYYNGDTEKKIIRLNTNGTNDITFNNGQFDNIIRTTEEQSDGKILAGGFFTSYNGNTENRIIRLNTDSTKDTSFNTGTGFDDNVYTIKKQTDEKIIVGGNFTTYKGVTQNYLIRLNTDGTKDVSFNIGTGFDGTVRIVKILDNGKILVGGDFTFYKGITANRIILLNADGTKDTSFNIGTGFDNDVYTIVQQTDGKFILGGFFTTYNGVTVNRIVRLNTTGTLDTTFTTGTAFSSTVLTMELQTDGKILVGGFFANFNGGTVNRIVRLNTNGTLDTSFNTGTSFDAAVRTIKQKNDGKIVVGGVFTTYNGESANRIITLNTDGSKKIGFIPGIGFDDDVYNINQLADGKILVGGNFSIYKGSTESAYLIKLLNKYTTTWDGNAWSDGEPDATTDAIIDGDYNLNISISADNLTVNQFKKLTINPGILLSVVGKLENNGTIIFKSDASGSGIFDIYSGENIDGYGNVITERFIPAKRAFRFVCSAVTSTANILLSWQNNRSIQSGIGTHITGGSTLLGFDLSATNNPSMFTWNNTTQNWSAVTNTKTNTLTAGMPYRLMVRGDRTIDLSTNTPTPTNTILRASGKLHVGNYSPSLNSAIDGFSFIGNPYQSVVNMKAVLTASTNMKNDALYYWDPTLNTRGAYVTRDLITDTNSITSAFNEYLQPGQAVFVQKDNTVNVPTLTITENNKATSQAAAGVFRVQNTQVSNTSYLKIELTSPNVSAVLDGSLLQFDAAYSWNVSSNDFIKLANQDEQLGFKLENKLLAIAKKSVPLNQDEVPLEITNYRQTNYQFNFDLVNYNGPTPYLFDALDASYTEINNATSKSFTVDTQNTLTTNPNRFKIVFNNAALSAAEFDFAAIKLYPNPIKASQKQAFTLSNIEENTTVNLFNSLGQEILVKTIYESGNVIVSATTVLSNGFYTVVVKTPSGNAKSFKLIVE